jgi:hypothetical protein
LTSDCNCARVTEKWRSSWCEARGSRRGGEADTAPVWRCRAKVRVRLRTRNWVAHCQGCGCFARVGAAKGFEIRGVGDAEEEAEEGGGASGAGDDRLSGGGVVALGV